MVSVPGCFCFSSWGSVVLVGGGEWGSFLSGCGFFLFLPEGCMLLCNRAQPPLGSKRKLSSHDHKHTPPSISNICNNRMLEISFWSVLKLIFQYKNIRVISVSGLFIITVGFLVMRIKAGDIYKPHPPLRHALEGSIGILLEYIVVFLFSPLFYICGILSGKHFV